MTNEEIVEQWNNDELSHYELVELARADEREKWKPYLLDSVLTDAEFKEYTGSEREKMQGVDCWVSWDNHHACGDVTASFKEPKANRNSDGSTYYNNYGAMSFDISEHAAKFLNIEPGQCKKFRIVEVLT